MKGAVAATALRCSSFVPQHPPINAHVAVKQHGHNRRQIGRAHRLFGAQADARLDEEGHAGPFPRACPPRPPPRSPPGWQFDPEDRRAGSRSTAVPRSRAGPAIARD